MTSTTPEVWRHLEDLERTDRCVIIGNGPSLKEVPDFFLDKYDTFGSNRIYLKYEPTFHVTVNPLVLEQCVEEIAGLKSTVFVSSAFQDRVPGSFPLISKPVPHFAREPWNGIYEGFTVTYVSLQLAFWMGYQSVLLIGVDHRYEYDGDPNQEVVSEGPDPNHFDPAYFGAGFRWHLPDLNRSKKAYRMAEVVFAAADRQVLNLTKNTALDVFEKGDLEDWL